MWGPCLLWATPFPRPVGGKSCQKANRARAREEPVLLHDLCSKLLPEFLPWLPSVMGSDRKHTTHKSFLRIDSWPQLQKETRTDSPMGKVSAFMLEGHPRRGEIHSESSVWRWWKRTQKCTNLVFIKVSSSSHRPEAWRSDPRASNMAAFGAQGEGIPGASCLLGAGELWIQWRDMISV